MTTMFSHRRAVLQGDVLGGEKTAARDVEGPLQEPQPSTLTQAWAVAKACSGSGLSLPPVVRHRCYQSWVSLRTM